MATFSPKNLYLILYNVIQTIGWSYILFSVAINYINGDSPDELWSKVGMALIIFQNAAILEVVHCLLGLVRAPVVTTLIQVLSRVMITYFCMVIPACRGGYIFTTLMVSWSTIEIVRYSFYATSLLEFQLYIHKWLRYTLFIVLYPSGVASELGTLYKAIPFLQSNGLFGILDFEIFAPVTMWALVIYFLMFVYIPGFPVMFGHMVKQRKKTLGAKETKQKKK